MPRSGAGTKEKILSAAQGQVMRRGFAATSVDAIQEAAGISRGTFFYHFPTKDDLARALLHRYADLDRSITDGFMERAEKLAKDPLQQLLIFLALHEEMFEESEEVNPGCLFASYSYEAGLFDAETMDVIKRAVAHWREVVSHKLRAAERVHKPRVDFDPETVADVTYGVMQGAFILSRVEQKPGIMTEHIRQLETYVELLFGAEGQGSN